MTSAAAPPPSPPSKSNQQLPSSSKASTKKDKSIKPPPPSPPSSSNPIHHHHHHQEQEEISSISRTSQRSFIRPWLEGEFPFNKSSSSSSSSSSSERSSPSSSLSSSSFTSSCLYVYDPDYRNNKKHHPAVSSPSIVNDPEFDAIVRSYPNSFVVRLYDPTQDPPYLFYLAVPEPASSSSSSSSSSQRTDRDQVPQEINLITALMMRNYIDSMKPQIVERPQELPLSSAVSDTPPPVDDHDEDQEKEELKFDKEEKKEEKQFGREKETEEEKNDHNYKVGEEGHVITNHKQEAEQKIYLRRKKLGRAGNVGGIEIEVAAAKNKEESSKFSDEQPAELVESRQGSGGDVEKKEKQKKKKKKSKKKKEKENNINIMKIKVYIYLIIFALIFFMWINYVKK